MITSKRLSDLKSITDAILEKLKAANILTIDDFLKNNSKYYVDNLKLTKIRAEKLLKEAKDASYCVFRTGKELLELYSQVLKLTTGVKSIDSILRGGVASQAITEFSGQFSIGKSQMSHQLSVLAQRPIEEGGLNSGVLFIDTEHTFRHTRILEIGSKYTDEPEKLLDNIVVIRPNSSEEQIHIIENILEKGNIIREDVKPINLIIVDSIIARFRSQYIGRQNLSQRQQKINKHLNDLLNFAVKYNSVVVITNQVSAVPQDTLYGPQTRITGGHVIAHSATYRCNIKNAKSGTRILKIIDAPDLPPLEALFEITTKGLVDV